MRPVQILFYSVLACQAALVAAIQVPATARAAEGEILSRIGFGSCAKQDKPQPIWDAIVAADPQRFVLLGDNIYADTLDMDVLRAKYQQLGDQPGFQRLKALCPVLATWDDHDYGGNDAGGDYPKKRESQQVFLDFFGAKPDDPRRTRPGIYSSYVFGPAGKRVQIILLDERYFRSPLKPGGQSREPGEGRRGAFAANNDPGATILGDAQWKWLADQLKVPANVRLIGSGFQCIANQAGSECWDNFPRERTRFFNLLRDTQARGVILLSGDRHFAEISELPAESRQGPGYALYEVTSSSLNAPGGAITKAKTRFLNDINSHRVGLVYFETNFGFVDIDWSAADPVIRLQVRDEQGDVVLQKRVLLGELRQH